MKTKNNYIILIENEKEFDDLIHECIKNRKKKKNLNKPENLDEVMFMAYLISKSPGYKGIYSSIEVKHCSDFYLDYNEPGYEIYYKGELVSEPCMTWWEHLDEIFHVIGHYFGDGEYLEYKVYSKENKKEKCISCKENLDEDIKQGIAIVNSICSFSGHKTPKEFADRVYFKKICPKCSKVNKIFSYLDDVSLSENQKKLAKIYYSDILENDR